MGDKNINSGEKQVENIFAEEMNSPEFQMECYWERNTQEITGADAVILLLNELEKAQKQSMCFAALGIALVLPDMCAKLEYNKNTTSEEYKKWVDKYVCSLISPDGKQPQYTIYSDEKGRYALKPDRIFNIPISLFSGEIIYRLRCSFFHEGVPNIINPRSKEDFISKIKFQLNLEDEDAPCAGVGITYTPKNFFIKKEETTISLELSAQEICCFIYIAVKKFYEQNKEKFKHITYRVKDTRRPIG